MLAQPQRSHSYDLCHHYVERLAVGLLGSSFSALEKVDSRSPKIVFRGTAPETRDTSRLKFTIELFASNGYIKEKLKQQQQKV